VSEMTKSPRGHNRELGNVRLKRWVVSRS